MILYPRLYCKKVTDITIEFLKENNIKGIILDVDNTLIDFDRNLLDGVVEWKNKIKETGIDFIILSNSNKKEKLTFFHSAGMSTRKGTDLLIEAFIEGKCYKKSSLIIHTQLPIKSLCKYSLDELNGFGISVIEKTVTAPGLYYLGDIYVYPTRLDGLGLTMYEALSSGLPVITTDFPPMNEAVNNDVGRLVKVEDFYCRGDAYYYPMAICSKDSLIESLNWYIEHPEQVCKQKVAAREYALANYDISVRSAEVSQVFEYATIREFDSSLYNNIMKYYGWRNSNFICYLRTSARLNTLIKTFFNK